MTFLSCVYATIVNSAAFLGLLCTFVQPMEFELSHQFHRLTLTTSIGTRNVDRTLASKQRRGGVLSFVQDSPPGNSFRLLPPGPRPLTFLQYGGLRELVVSLATADRQSQGCQTFGSWHASLFGLEWFGMEDNATLCCQATVLTPTIYYLIPSLIPAVDY